jgi:hypothetical protein
MHAHSHRGVSTRVTGVVCVLVGAVGDCQLGAAQAPTACGMNRTTDFHNGYHFGRYVLAVQFIRETNHEYERCVP